MNQRVFVFLSLLFFLFLVFFSWQLDQVKKTPNKTTIYNQMSKFTSPSISMSSSLNISSLQSQSFPGSPFVIEKILQDGVNYHQFIVSYKSEGLKIYGLLTVPIGSKPKPGWPAILFNHGYVPPDQYQTYAGMQQYGSYISVLARNGFIVFKPDYRGNGDSEGIPDQSYVSAGYIIDDMNALKSLEIYKNVNPKRVGLWAHSMGGNIALHDLVITHDLKAAVIWSGVVGSYPEIVQWWQNRVDSHSITGNDLKTSSQLMIMVQQLGTPKTNPVFWHSIDPIYYLQNVTTPIQLDVGIADETVPPTFSLNLQQRLKSTGKTVELYEYPGNDHNISQSFNLAMQRTINFYNQYLR